MYNGLIGCTARLPGGGRDFTGGGYASWGESLYLTDQCYIIIIIIKNVILRIYNIYSN